MSLALSDLTPVLRQLVELGRGRKWITYEEYIRCVPDEFVEPEKVDEMIVLLDELGIELIDETERKRNGWDMFEAPLQTNLKFQRDERKPNKPPRRTAPRSTSTGRSRTSSTTRRSPPPPRRRSSTTPRPRPRSRPRSTSRAPSGSTTRSACT